MIRLFITGTDTDIGKTYISVGLLERFTKLGLATLGMKPLASGCYEEDRRLINQDAVDLIKASSIQVDYQLVNPFAFRQAIAPHLAARQENYFLTKKKIVRSIFRTLDIDSDVTIVEGIGGWCTPINDDEFMSEVITSVQLPVILVVGLKLGCLNHAILTARAIQKSKLPFIGWIGNCIDPYMQAVSCNAESLKAFISAPCLGIVRYGYKLDHIDLQPIFKYFV